MAGFSLITVLFLLVVVTGIGGYLVNLSVTQHLGSALAGQESRAYYAALSGLEWAAYSITNDPNDPPNCPAVGTSFAVEGFSVPANLEPGFVEIIAFSFPPPFVSSSPGRWPGRGRRC